MRLLLAFLFVLAPAVGAQPSPVVANAPGAGDVFTRSGGEAGWVQPAPEVVWERIGLEGGARALAFRPGTDGDTLYALDHTKDLRRLSPSDTAWSGGLHTLTGGGERVILTEAGTILLGARAGPVKIDRSVDGGRTWQRLDVGGGVECLYERPSNGILLACADTSLDGLFISHDDGQTWQTLGIVTADAPSVANVLIEHPTGAGGAPRLIAGVQNGLAYSDDGGATWRRSNVWGAYRWWGSALALAPDASPDAGTVYAVAVDFADTRAVVFASEDGGATWTERSRVGVWFASLVAGPDGALYVGLDGEQPGGAPMVVRSGDGGRTWAGAQEGYEGTCVLDLEVGSDGRLYLAGCSGVWRTVDPLPVQTEASPQQAGARLGALYPNPAQGQVTVPLVVAQPGAVRVAVYDVLGRQVAVLHDGWLAAGEHAFRLDASALPAGVYVVRASGGGASLTRRVVLAR